METRGYDRMQEESSADPDERHAQIYPMVTYRPETLEANLEIKGQRPRSVQQRVLRCAFLISLTNTIVAAVCLVFASIARSMSGSNYEPCMTVCCMVIVDSCLVWFLRYQGKRVSQEGSFERFWTGRIFLCCYIAVVVVAVCSVVVAGVAVYVLERGELTDCQKAFYSKEVLEESPCREDSETRYFMSILAVTLLAAMAILTIVILGFSFSIGRKFSFKLTRANSDTDKRDRGRQESGNRDRDTSNKVIVTKEDETGRKVVYKYNDKEDIPEVEHDCVEQPDSRHESCLVNSEV